MANTKLSWARIAEGSKITILKNESRKVSILVPAPSPLTSIVEDEEKEDLEDVVTFQPVEPIVPLAVPLHQEVIHPNVEFAADLLQVQLPPEVPNDNGLVQDALATLQAEETKGRRRKQKFRSSWRKKKLAKGKNKQEGFTKRETIYVVVDGEMTGIAEEGDELMEIGVILVNEHLEELGQFEGLFYVSPEKIKKMNPWCQRHHHKSGLVYHVSVNGKPASQIDKELVSFIKSILDPQETGQLRNFIFRPVGSCIYTDLRFIKGEIPEFYSLLDYKLIDLSTISDLLKKYNPELWAQRPRTFKPQHRALPDAWSALNLFRFFRDNVFTPVPFCEEEDPVAPTPVVESVMVMEQQQEQQVIQPTFVYDPTYCCWQPCYGEVPVYYDWIQQ